MRVRDAMTTGVITAKQSDEVLSVVEKMIMRRCGSIPVVSDDGMLEGIVTIRDVLLPLYPGYGDYVHDTVHARDFELMESGYTEVMKQKVEEICTKNPFTVSPDDSVLKAASFMGVKNFRRIPVTENGKLVGIVSLGDINRVLFMHQQVESHMGIAEHA